MFDKLLNNINEINKRVSIISDGSIVAFPTVSLRTIDTTIPIHGFYTSISWLYVLYYETGSATIKFLLERARAYNYNTSITIEKLVKVVHAMRTLLQHNINHSSMHDRSLLACCNDWLNSIINETSNNDILKSTFTEQQWEILLKNIINESIIATNVLLDAVEKIADDEYVSDIIELWNKRITRQLRPNEWDNIVSIVLNDLGMECLDITKVRQKNFEKWNKDLLSYSDSHDIDKLARALVEKSLINLVDLQLPITGTDIIQYCSLRPGPIIKELLVYAQTVYSKKKCSKPELLLMIKRHVEEDMSQ